MSKYPEYRVRDDSEELGTLSIVDEKGQTLFLRNRTCLGIVEDANLMASAPRLAHALEELWAAYDKANFDDFDRLNVLVRDALDLARNGLVDN